jgi:hypothetical protein
MQNKHELHFCRPRLSLAAPVTREVFSFCCVAQREEELQYQRNDVYRIVKTERTIWPGACSATIFDSCLGRQLHNGGSCNPRHKAKHLIYVHPETEHS